MGPIIHQWDKIFNLRKKYCEQKYFLRNWQKSGQKSASAYRIPYKLLEIQKKRSSPDLLFYNRRFDCEQIPANLESMGEFPATNILYRKMNITTKLYANAHNAASPDYALRFTSYPVDQFTTLLDVISVERKNSLPL